MKYSDQKTRMRRFLRDPDASIWTDAFLRQLFNDSQRELSDHMAVDGIEAVRVPPRYGSSMLFDWEWTHATTKVYQALRLHHQSGWVCCFKWQLEQLNNVTPTETESGYAYTHPWEAFEKVCNAQPPVWFPHYFESAFLVAYDKKPLEYVPLKQIQSDDSSWESRSGEPWAYTRRDTLSNELYLYPRPLANVWDNTSGTQEVGAVLDTSDDASVSAETGTITQRTGSLFDDEAGVVTDMIRPDDNLLVISNNRPADITGDNDTSQYPVFLRKYVEFGAISDAYRANTDGRIESLADYWQWRKELGFEMVTRFKIARRQDRNYRITTPGGYRSKSRPRLPDGYPPIRV